MDRSGAARGAVAGAVFAATGSRKNTKRTPSSAEGSNFALDLGVFASEAALTSEQALSWSSRSRRSSSISVSAKPSSCARFTKRSSGTALPRTPGRQKALTELFEETLALVIVGYLDVRAHLGSRLAGAESSALDRFCDGLVIHVVS